MSLTARLLGPGELGPAQVSAWRDLVRRAAEPNPFFEPDYLLATIRHRGVPLTLLTVAQGSDWLACLPLYGHGRLSRLGPPTWSIPHVLGLPHTDPGQPHDALRTAIDFLAARWRPRRVLHLHRVPVDGIVGPALLAAIEDRRCPGWEPAATSCPFIRRREAPTYLQDTLLGRTRRKLGQKRRNLEQQTDGPLRLVDRGAEPAAVEKLLSLEGSGWKGAAGTAMVNLPGEAEFFRTVCAAFGAAGRLHLLSLEAGNTTLAMRCDVAAGNRLFSLKATYDERFARFSPGLLLEMDSVALFHQGSAAWLYSATNHPGSPAFEVHPDRQTLVHPVVALDRLTGLALHWWPRRHRPPVPGVAPEPPGGASAS